jgi:hypothetical protein
MRTSELTTQFQEPLRGTTQSASLPRNADQCPGWVNRYRIGRPPHVRFPPDSDHEADISGGPFRANTGTDRGYSITSSALLVSDAGTVNPSAFAAFILMTNSSLVDCWTGRSAGFAPDKILPA